MNELPSSITFVVLLCAWWVGASPHSDPPYRQVLPIKETKICRCLEKVMQILADLPRNKVMSEDVSMTIQACLRGRSPATVLCSSATGSENSCGRPKGRHVAARKKINHGCSVVISKTPPPATNIKRNSEGLGKDRDGNVPVPDRKAQLKLREGRGYQARGHPPVDITKLPQTAPPGRSSNKKKNVKGNMEGKKNRFEPRSVPVDDQQSNSDGTILDAFEQPTNFESLRFGTPLSIPLREESTVFFIICYLVIQAVAALGRTKAQTGLYVDSGGTDLISSICQRDGRKASSKNLTATGKQRGVEGKAFPSNDGTSWKEKKEYVAHVCPVSQASHLKSFHEFGCDLGFCDGEIVEVPRSYVEDIYEYKLEHPPNNPNNQRSPDRIHSFEYEVLHQSSGTSRLQNDGRISDDIGDPPGQQTIYIRPGDARLESYRLSTFESFPINNHNLKRNLAKAGFVFTGFFDRVKCYGCGRHVEQLGERDDPFDRRWHKPFCPMTQGQNSDNVPITTLAQPFAAMSSNNQPDQILLQRDPRGNETRTVRYPAVLPERIRSNGGTFQIGSGNTVIIQSGSVSNPNRLNEIGNRSAPHPRWRMANVVSADHRRFLSNLYLNRELDRLTSFARWPSSRPNVSPVSLARSGFFYLGDMDRTQCFSCGGVLRNWTLEDDAQEEHRTHFPNCPLINGSESRNIPIPDRPEPSDEREGNYPCRYAASPHMRSQQSRVETFSHGWPTGRTSATPQAIAEAGFFFLGQRDRVKCWYCNGGLQNWEYDDIPWVEHAKWFPNCQFLLRTKGQNFVFRHLAMNPQLQRPIIARQEGSPLEPTAQAAEVAPPMDIAPVRQATPPPVIIDPREEMRKKKERIENTMKNSEIVKSVMNMGFSEDVIRQLLEERIDAGNGANHTDIYESATSLLDAVFEREAEMQREAENRNHGAVSMSTAYNAFSETSANSSFGSMRMNLWSSEENVVADDKELYESASPAASNANSSEPRTTDERESGISVREKLKKLQEERMCKICFSKDADIAFIPCGHMCCCIECTQSIRQCPMCRKRIEKAIKTYVT